MFKAIENFKNNLTEPAKRKFESLIKDNPWGKKNIDETNAEDSSSSIYIKNIFFQPLLVFFVVRHIILTLNKTQIRK